VPGKDNNTTDTDSDNGHQDKKSLTKKTEKQDQPISNDSNDDEELNSTRRLFGLHQSYIIDAKKTGNLGRFLNHSCQPNLVVQNVFFKHHDLRFPSVAFFTSSVVRAGTELTWDYGYKLDSVPGKTIHCFCGAVKCRKRLL